MRRRVIIGGLGIILVSIVLVSIFVLNIFSSPYDGSTRLNLSATVTVHRGENGLPHIRATSMGDMFLALGFVHATDRINEMEYMRSIAHGKISYYLNNSDTQKIDTLVNSLQLHIRAERICEKLSDHWNGMLINYVDGINSTV